MKPIGGFEGRKIMKKNKLFGRAINDWAIDLDYEDHVALFDYMIDWLKKLNINYEIEKSYHDENHVYIRVDCDDEMMDILRNLYEDFEYDWSEE
jgi:dimeric dUTPase (all-alpha-NTP-PPase superfamily)